MYELISVLLNEEGHAKLVGALDSGASPNVRIYRDITALMYVCEEFLSPDKVLLLLKHGAEVDARDSGGRTALLRFLERIYLCEYVDDEKVDEQLRDADSVASRYFRIPVTLLDGGADPNARDHDDITPLMWCGENHDRLECAWELLERGADPDIRDAKGHTALTKAAARRVYFTDHESNRAMMPLLADLTTKTLPEPQDGVTPMVAAINSANVFAIGVLRDVGYPVAVTPSFRHLEPVAAATEGDMGRLQQALRDGHSLEARTEMGRTPLMWAARMGHLEMVRDLLDMGADLEAAGEVFGKPGTALFTAVEGNHLEVCSLLLERGAKHVIYDQDALKKRHPEWEDTQGNNVLRLALDLNANRRGDSYRDICLLLWEAVEDKRGIDMTSPTVVELSKLSRRKIKK